MSWIVFLILCACTEEPSEKPEPIEVVEPSAEPCATTVYYLMRMVMVLGIRCKPWRVVRIRRLRTKQHDCNDEYEQSRNVFGC